MALIMKDNKLVISYIKAGFGNQLFQYATGYAMAKRIGADFKLDLSFYTGERKSQFKLDYLQLDYQIASKQEVSELKNLEPAPFLYRVLKKLGISSAYYKPSHLNDTLSFEPDQNILEWRKSAYISGWCTAIDYFSDVKEDLRNLFKLRDGFSKSAEHYRKEMHNSDSVALHIRRGDYVELEHFFKVQDLSYYEKAREVICAKLDNPHFFVFSNDIDWVREKLGNWSNQVTFISLTSIDKDYNGAEDIEEFFLMAECKHHIIANSSFSWWPAYLNNKDNKLVVAPEIWYNDTVLQSKFNKSPLFLKDWISI